MPNGRYEPIKIRDCSWGLRNRIMLRVSVSLSIGDEVFFLNSPSIRSAFQTTYVFPLGFLWRLVVKFDVNQKKKIRAFELILIESNEMLDLFPKIAGFFSSCCIDDIWQKMFWVYSVEYMSILNECALFVYVSWWCNCSFRSSTDWPFS